MMIFATADIHPCIPLDNLSTAQKHYGTYTNLCSTAANSLKTCCNLPTATNLQQIKRLQGLPKSKASLYKIQCLRNPRQS